MIHGIPDDRPLVEGDVVGCDIGVILNGYYSDACKTFPSVKSPSVRPVFGSHPKFPRRSHKGLSPGRENQGYGKAVSDVVTPHGYGIVYSYCGHGVGLSLHEDPQIPNYYPSRGSNPRMKSGMVLAIEPMVNAGTADIEVLDDAGPSSPPMVR